jgi:hypothetical protein
MRARSLLAALVVGSLGMFALGGEAHAGNYVLHFQGRSAGSWTSDSPGDSRMPLAAVSGQGWVNKTFAFNGNARIASPETDSTTNPNSVNAALRTYCGAGTGNSCIVHCYSAGCYRAMKAIDDIRSGVGGSADTLSGMLYMQGSGSVDGGTDLAEIATGLFTGWLAKLLGQQEAIDKDLTRSVARSTYSYIHDAMPVQYWHVAGNLDVCKKLLGFIKICGGGQIAGNDDGVVPWASSAGFATQAARTSLCNSSAAEELDVASNVPNKYPKHRTDTTWIDCDGTTGGASTASWDHFGIPDVGEAIIEGDIKNAATIEYKYWKWSDATTEPMCTADVSCDNAFASTTATDFTKYPDGTATDSASVDSQTSQTFGVTGSAASCAGRCGTAPAGWCACTTGASNKCGDYNANHCDYINQ